MTNSPRDPMPELCGHDDADCCTAECDEKGRLFDEWLYRNLLKEIAQDGVLEYLAREALKAKQQ